MDGWIIAGSIGYVLMWAILTGVTLGVDLKPQQRIDPDYFFPTLLVMAIWPFSFSLWLSIQIVDYLMAEEAAPPVCPKCKRPRSQW